MLETPLFIGHHRRWPAVVVGDDAQGPELARIVDRGLDP
jgi:hypothetical protein